MSQNEKVQTIIAKIQSFLATPNLSGNDWPEISPKEMQEFQEICLAVADAKWGEDCDGDSPIRVLSFSRRTHELPWSMPLPKEFPHASARMAASALHVYSERMDYFVNHQLSTRNDEREAVLASINADLSWCKDQGKVDFSRLQRVVLGR